MTLLTAAEAVAAERARIRAAVEGLPHVECVDLDCSHDDLSYSQREHPWLDRAAVLAAIEEAKGSPNAAEVGP